jgi:hypothetical protein
MPGVSWCIRSTLIDNRKKKSMADTERCARCQEVKPVTAFYTHKKWDGFHPYCKVCFNAYSKARREKKLAANPELVSFRWKRDLVRHDYFRQIDSPLKAYILGFLAADGNLLARLHRITLELAAKDSALLALIRDELAPGCNLRSRSRRGGEYVVLNFTSHQMFADLVALGVTPAKSLVIEWPTTLPDCYAREFILGVFDGDGFITYYQRGSVREPYVGFIGASLQLLKKIVDVIEQQTGVRIAGPWAKGSSKAFLIRVGGRKAYIVDQWLHATGLGLARKRLAPRDDGKLPTS